MNEPLFSDREWQELVDDFGLPPRQAEVLQLLVEGECDKQIAQRLAISPPTVRTYVQRMYSRFGESDRAGLVIHVFRRFRIISN